MFAVQDTVIGSGLWDFLRDRFIATEGIYALDYLEVLPLELL